MTASFGSQIFDFLIDCIGGIKTGKCLMRAYLTELKKCIARFQNEIDSRPIVV